jgi:uncharacterized protein YecE (DUF72 family)
VPLVGRTMPAVDVAVDLDSLPSGLWVGTSGFAYPGWVPRFYPAGTRGDAMLRRYGERLDACELNNTYYQQPTEARIAAWRSAVPGRFRFTVKAHRNGSQRAFAGDAAGTLPWMLAPLVHFGEQLGPVLWRVPANQPRDDGRLAALLAAWPAGQRLALEFQDGSWAVPEVHDRLREAGAGLCLTDLDGADVPQRVATADFAYLRLRRDSYDEEALQRWAEWLAGELAEGHEAYVFVRHDADGAAPGRALDLAGRVARLAG